MEPNGCDPVDIELVGLDLNWSWTKVMGWTCENYVRVSIIGPQVM
jgi:hypothetical protein